MSYTDENYTSSLNSSIEFDSDSDNEPHSLPHPPIPEVPEDSPIPLPLSTDFINAENDINQPHLTDMLQYQSNVNTFYKQFTHDLTFLKRAIPLTFFGDYSTYSIYETSQKILLPKEILSKLTEYENLELPIYVKINDGERIFGVLDYVDFVEHVYIPTPLFYDLNLTENEDIILSVLKEQPPKASKITLKPLSEEFYDISNVKTYLEVWLKKMRLTLHEGEIITLPYMKSTISLYIDCLEPAPIVSIHEIEEVEIDLLPMDEYANKTSVEFTETETEEEINEQMVQEQVSPADVKEEAKFIPFSGKGNKLGKS